MKSCRSDLKRKDPLQISLRNSFVWTKRIDRFMDLSSADFIQTTNLATHVFTKILSHKTCPSLHLLSNQTWPKTDENAAISLKRNELKALSHPRRKSELSWAKIFILSIDRTQQIRSFHRTLRDTLTSRPLRSFLQTSKQHLLSQIT